MKDIKRLLIANRGEIACRIIRTAKKMGIYTIAVYSEADVGASHVREADATVPIGPASATLSYLNVKKIIEAAKISGADAVHPGYGFLSENPAFAEALVKNGITFVGPTADAIRKMGDKIQAKKIAQEAGLNIVPGYIGAIKGEKEAMKIATKIGYPIIIKAAAGGGGRGIRIVHSPEEMSQAFKSTKHEAKANFSDARAFIEKYIQQPRHIEVQVIADQHGNVVCLGERECSTQRRHQKIIEEAPSKFITPAVRQKMYEQVVALVKKVKYFSAGTVEFIVDGSQENSKKHFYFMEMNTRLQVEHPVTELVTGFDIVELMIRVARGEALPIKQSDVKFNGWALECRVYAEDPSCGFLPSTGRISSYREPPSSPSIRIDTGVDEGDEVSMFYDAMISKVCTHAPTRAEAIQIMQKALSAYLIQGISHNIPFLQALLSSQKFLDAKISTNFIDEEYKSGFSGSQLSSEESAVILSAGLFIFLNGQKRLLSISGQLVSGQKSIPTRWVVIIGERKYPVTVRPIDDGYKITFDTRRVYITSRWIIGNKIFQCTINGVDYSMQAEVVGTGVKVTFMGSSELVKVMTPRAAELTKYMIKKAEAGGQHGKVMANIAGMVVDVKIQEGAQVVRGQPLVILEAMKMENILSAQIDGVVTKLNVAKGQTVVAGDVLVTIEAESSNGNSENAEGETSIASEGEVMEDAIS